MGRVTDTADFADGAAGIAGAAPVAPGRAPLVGPGRVATAGPDRAATAGNALAAQHTATIQQKVLSRVAWAHSGWCHSRLQLPAAAAVSPYGASSHRRGKTNTSCGYIGQL